MQASLKIGIAATLLAGTAGQAARAGEFIPGGEEHIRIFVGGVLARIASSVAVDGTVSNGSLVDLSGPGASKNANNFILGAQWRVGSRHRISGLYFTTKKDRSLSFDRSITIGDDTLVPPTTLDTSARNRFLFATYQYSFVKNENIELAGQLGAYLNKFTVDLTGTANITNTSNGTSTTTRRAVSYQPGVTVPMPLIGGTIDWFVTPRFTVGAGLSGLKAKIGDVNGSVFVATASAEYMVTRNVGVGVSYMHSKLDIDVAKTNFNGHLNWKNDNILAFALLKF
jgi:hypothetical protein